MTRRYGVSNVVDDAFAFGSVHHFGSQEMGFGFRVWKVLLSYGYLAGILASNE
jgi:hypothetical protein